MAHTLDADTLALWRFNESTAGANADETGNHNIDTSTGTQSMVAGAFGRAVKCNGDGSISAPTTAALRTSVGATGGWTFESWIHIAAADWRDYFAVGYETIFGIGDPATDAWLFSIWAANFSGLRQFYVGNSARSYGLAQSNVTSVPADVYGHLAIVCRATGGGNYVYDLYWDGALLGTSGSSGVAPPAGTSAMRIYFGDGDPVGVGSFKGRVRFDDVRISSVERTAAEIAASAASWEPTAIASQFDTVASIISDASAELGLGAVADPYGSTDANVVRLRTVFKRVGRLFAKKREWPALTKEHTFATADGTASYDLPDGFVRMVDQTSWSRTNQRRALPIDAEAWQYTKTGAVTASSNILFRPRTLTLEISPTPSAVETVAFEYLSRFWVSSDGSADGDLDAPTANTDTVLFDPSAMVLALKAAWKMETGFDAASAEADLEEAYALAVREDVKAAPVLNAAGSVEGVRLIDENNIPDTGYAQ